MEKDRTKGKIKDIKGRIKRQTGEWTGNEELQTEGALDQAEGKVQNAWGKVKDRGRQIEQDTEREADRKRKEREAEREVQRKDRAA